MSESETRSTEISFFLTDRQGKFIIFTKRSLPIFRLRQIRLTSVVALNKADVMGAVHANLRLLTPWTEMLFIDLQHTPSPAEFNTRLVGSMGRNNAQLKSQLIVSNMTRFIRPCNAISSLITNRYKITTILLQCMDFVFRRCLCIDANRTDKLCCQTRVC